MRYISVEWIHDFDDEPVKYHLELDDVGFEVRKIVVYRDDHVAKASELIFDDETYLAEDPTPEIDELNTDPQFKAEEITQDEFESKWNELAD